MRYFIFIIIIFLSIYSYAESVTLSKAGPELKKSIDSLAELLNDTYSSSTMRSVYELPNDQVAVLFNTEGRGGGNNYQQFLAVFKMSKKSRLISGETYEYYGPKKYNLIGLLLVGKKLMGSLSITGLQYEKKILTLTVEPGRFGYNPLEPLGLVKGASTVSIKIGHYSLHVVKERAE